MATRFGAVFQPKKIASGCGHDMMCILIFPAFFFSIVFSSTTILSLSRASQDPKLIYKRLWSVFMCNLDASSAVFPI